MQKSLRNFLISFAAGLLIFGLFAISIPRLFFPEDDTYVPSDSVFDNPDNSTKQDEENNDNSDESDKVVTGKTFTALVGGYDNTTGELDGLVFIKADKENKRFVISAIPTTLSVVITSTDPADELEDVTETEEKKESSSASPNVIKTNVRIKDFPLRFMEGEKINQILDTVYAITGMKVDYYAFFTMDAAKKLFNKTQGLYYTVPENMLYIGTGTEEKPEIKLEAGGQVLDTDEIIGLLRYAAYSTDEKRNDTKRALLQAEFVSEGIKQILKNEPEKLISSIGSILSECETNFTSADFKDNFDLISKFGEYSGSSVVMTVNAADPIECSFTQKLFENYK